MELAGNTADGASAVLEILGETWSRRSKGGFAAPMAANVTLTQGKILIIPSYVLRRSLPVRGSAGGRGRAFRPHSHSQSAMQSAENSKSETRPTTALQ